MSMRMLDTVIDRNISYQNFSYAFLSYNIFRGFNVQTDILSILAALYWLSHLLVPVSLRCIFTLFNCTTTITCSVTFALMTHPLHAASPCHVCTLWTLALANSKGQAHSATIICPCVMKWEHLKGGSENILAGGLVSLKGASLRLNTGSCVPVVVLYPLDASLEGRMELPKLEPTRLRRCDSAGET